jgi:DUF1680 family protein
LPGYFYSSSRDGIYVNLYHNSELDWHLDDGTLLKLSQATGYPWSGDVKLTVNPAHPADFTLYVRWPAWAPSFDIQVNGQDLGLANAHRGSFIPISRSWKSGDTVSLNMPLQPAMMAANPRVTDDYGRVAIQRGPLVYVLEQLDQNGIAIPDVFLKAGATFSVDYRKDVLGGIAELKVSGLAAERSVGDEPLYRAYGSGANRPKHMVNLTFIPYYTVGNREPSPFEVWVPVSPHEQTISSGGVLGAEKHFENR